MDILYAYMEIKCVCISVSPRGIDFSPVPPTPLHSNNGYSLCDGGNHLCSPTPLLWPPPKVFGFFLEISLEIYDIKVREIIIHRFKFKANNF